MSKFQEWVNSSNEPVIITCYELTVNGDIISQHENEWLVTSVIKREDTRNKAYQQLKTKGIFIMRDRIYIRLDKLTEWLTSTGTHLA